MEIYMIRVALLALGQSLDCHSASEVSLMDMRNQSMYNHNKAQQSKNRVHIYWDILYAIIQINHEWPSQSHENLSISIVKSRTKQYSDDHRNKSI